MQRPRSRPYFIQCERSLRPRLAPPTAPQRRGPIMNATLRLVENPVDRLARAVEAMLVIAPAPLAIEELAAAAEDEMERAETALGLLASRYRATPLFERVFGLAGLSELPRLDDLAEGAEDLRARLEEVAGRRGA